MPKPPTTPSPKFPHATASQLTPIKGEIVYDERLPSRMLSMVWCPLCTVQSKWETMISVLTLETSIGDRTVATTVVEPATLRTALIVLSSSLLIKSGSVRVTDDVGVSEATETDVTLRLRDAVGYSMLSVSDDVSVVLSEELLSFLLLGECEYGIVAECVVDVDGVPNVSLVIDSEALRVARSENVQDFVEGGEIVVLIVMLEDPRRCARDRRFIEVVWMSVNVFVFFVTSFENDAVSVTQSSDTLVDCGTPTQGLRMVDFSTLNCAQFEGRDMVSVYHTGDVMVP
jgi:hypothetical protein